MPNKEILFCRPLGRFGVVAILVLATSLLTSCAVVHSNDDPGAVAAPQERPGPEGAAVTEGSEGGSDATEARTQSDSEQTSDDSISAPVAPNPGSEKAEAGTEDEGIEPDPEESENPIDDSEEAESLVPQDPLAGDRLLFTTKTRAPSAVLPEDIQERETWPYLTLEDAPIEEVLEMFIKIMPERGTFNYIVDPGVKTKKITTRFWKPVRPENLWFILQSILTMNGLAMVDSGRDFYKIVPLPNARQLPIDTFVGRSGDHLDLEDSLVTQVIPTEHILPSGLLKLVKPFLSGVSFEIANDETMLLIITDLAANIKRIMTFVKLLDVPMATEELQVFPVQYADASEIASILEKLFSSKTTKTSAATTSRSRSKRSRSSKTAETASSDTSGSLGGFAEKPVIITDKRSNSLIVLGRKAALKAVETVVEMLDVDVYGAEKTYVYYLEHAEAKTMASLLTSLYSKNKGTKTGSRSTKKSSSPFSDKVRGKGSSGSISEGLISGEVNIVADEHTNSLIIITDPINYPEIKRTIEALDIRPKQVLIEVLIAELTLDKTTQFGLEWALKGQGTAQVLGEEFNVLSDIAQSLQVPSGSGFVLSVFDAERLKGLLNAYASQSKLNVLSTPRIIASNNKQAKIYVGKDVPIVTSETSSSSTSVSSFDVRRTIQYKDTGIILDVTPHVNEKKKVKLEISQTVSDAQTNKIGGSDSPIVNRREVTTTVFVDDNSTLLIGGLIKKNTNTAKEGIPLLMDIPWLGSIFSSTSIIETNTELLILITPRVIDSPKEGIDAIDDYEESMKELFEEIRKRRGAFWHCEEGASEQAEPGITGDEPEAGSEPSSDDEASEKSTTEDDDATVSKEQQP